MPFVRRDRSGEVDALFRSEEPGITEWSPGHHPAILNFLDGGANTGFAVLDTELIRVIEDLTDTLIDKGLLRMTDLPGSAQTKLLSRKGFRFHTAAETDPENLFGSSEVI